MLFCLVTVDYLGGIKARGVAENANNKFVIGGISLSIRDQ